MLLPLVHLKINTQLFYDEVCRKVIALKCNKWQFYHKSYFSLISSVHSCLVFSGWISIPSTSSNLQNIRSCYKLKIDTPKKWGIFKSAVLKIVQYIERNNSNIIPLIKTNPMFHLQMHFSPNICNKIENLYYG